MHTVYKLIFLLIVNFFPPCRCDRSSRKNDGGLFSGGGILSGGSGGIFGGGGNGGSDLFQTLILLRLLSSATTNTVATTTLPATTSQTLTFTNNIFRTASGAIVSQFLYPATLQPVDPANIIADPLTGFVYDSSTNKVVVYRDPTTGVLAQAFVTPAATGNLTDSHSTSEIMSDQGNKDFDN
ncbi:uncharacterized protein LOC131948197 [Physella acuta]|uniref:uncharacterized protein LOC131948197 n=1 Tax=Physella acuta TaxID=109671 RepID=UPI0027DD082C|nr:uncharacterized protein LOC131948197 [Physella acuta]